MTHALTIRLPEDTYERLRIQAFENRTTINTLILNALEPKQRSSHDAP